MKRRNFNAMLSAVPVLAASATKPAAPLWGKPLYKWQETILAWSQEFGAMVAVSTCFESGKTSVLVPGLALIHVALHPGSQVVVVSPSEHERASQAVPAFENSVGPHVSMRGNTFYLPSVDGLPESEIIFLSAVHSHDTLEGFSSRVYRDCRGNERFAPIMVIVDSAQSVSEATYAVLDKINPLSIMVLLGTSRAPNDSLDRRVKSPLWKSMTVSWEECPHLLYRPGRRRMMRVLEERGHPALKSILYGEPS